MRDIERLAPEQALKDNFLYFVESRAVLKRHPLAVSSGAVLTRADMVVLDPSVLLHKIETLFAGRLKLTGSSLTIRVSPGLTSIRAD